MKPQFKGVWRWIAVGGALAAFVFCVVWALQSRHAGYTDTAPFPAAPVKWTYRAIYHVGDSQVGLWSLPVSVTVAG